MSAAHPWQGLIDGLIEGVWIVDAFELRIVATNRQAAELLGMRPDALVGRPVVELAATPEDVYFWEDVAAGLSDHILSETLLLGANEVAVPVERRVTHVLLPDGGVFVVGLRDQSEERRVGNELEKLVAELRATLESTADGILVTDLDGAIRGYNHRFAELWELPQALSTERDDASVYRWMARNVADPAGYAARLAAIEQAPLLETTDLLVLRSGTVLERVSMPQCARSRPIGRVYSFRDITRRLADEARLQLAAKVFEASLDAIFVTDPDFVVIAANAGCERQTGKTRESLIGSRADSILTGSSISQEHFNAQLRNHLDKEGFWEGEAWHRDSSGNTLPCHASLVRVVDADERVLHYIGFFKDLSETVNARKRIEELAYTDALTGLPNRLMLTERIDFAISLAEREHSAFALLFIDLDRFKQINDSLGHQFGDRVLIEVAERITECLRQVDTAARLGGDEFLVLLHNVDTRGAEITARRILERLSQPFELDGMSFSVTCSIGIALFPEDGHTMDDLVKNADSAMYHVKERGRAGFRFYQRQMNVGLLSRMKLDHAMRQALANGDFRLCYQPQVSFGNNAIFGAEALLRWRNEELGEIPPGQFIPIAEETGLIVGIGQWVMREAIRQCAAWHAAGLAVSMAVNVSALQFQQTDFVDGVERELRALALPAEFLELELTESILVHEVEETMRRLEALAALGVRLSVDDFGTGYSSLSYLKRFPIHKLKIDRSFVNDLPADESDAAIVDAIIRMAGALRLCVIAEGVETQEQRDFLVAAGCHECQGYLYAPALEPTAFAAMARGGVLSSPAPSPPPPPGAA